MGFDFAVIAPILPSHCGFSFVFGCGVSFLVSSSFFLLMIVQQLVVILVFSQEGVTVHPSTPPSWFLKYYVLFLCLASLTLHNVSDSFLLWHVTVDHFFLLLSNILSVDEHWSLQFGAIEWLCTLVCKSLHGHTHSFSWVNT